MEILLVILAFPLGVLIGMILTSDGECYYCGKRFDNPPPRINGKKMCDNCWASGKGREGL